MTPASITCPHCHQTIPLDQVLTHQIEDKFKKEYADRYAADVVKIEQQAREKAEALIKQKLDLELKNSQTELIEAKKRNEQLITQLTDLNRLIRELRRKDEERILEMEKRLVAEEEKIRADALKKATEEQHLKILEKEKQLQNALKETEELRRKLQQGSQQNQGEVLELELEKLLKQEFPNDKVTPVGKGVRGADIIQEVWDRTGVRCGTILWETKNAKWNEEWVGKLKNDQHQLKAETAVIVSENLPPFIKSAAYYKGVWVVYRVFAVGIAMSLRAGLIQMHLLKRSLQGKAEKKEILWNYLTSIEFKHRMDAIFETFNLMRQDLEREKQFLLKNWAKKEKQLELMTNHTMGLRGDLEGLLGNALPESKIENEQQLSLEESPPSQDKQ